MLPLWVQLPPHPPRRGGRTVWDSGRGHETATRRLFIRTLPRTHLPPTSVPPSFLSLAPPSDPHPPRGAFRRALCPAPPRHPELLWEEAPESPPGVTWWRR